MTAAMTDPVTRAPPAMTEGAVGDDGGGREHVVQEE